MSDIYKFLHNTTRFELIYTDEKFRQTFFHATILLVLEDKIQIAIPEAEYAEYKNTVCMSDKLVAIFYTAEGVLSSNVNYLDNEGDNENIYISFPYNNNVSQRRENNRTPMHIDFELEINNENGNTSVKYDLKSKNISGRGIACITDEKLPDFENSKMKLHFNNRDILLICRKVYSKTIIVNDKTLYLNGIEFTKISDEDTKFIMKQCLHFEVNAKHNERLFETL